MNVGRTAISQPGAIGLLVALSACNGGGEGSSPPPVPGNLNGFSGPLTSMSQPVVFNTAQARLRTNCAGCDVTSSLTAFSDAHQIRIDPSAGTVEIIRSNVTETIFYNVDYTSGTMTKGNYSNPGPKPENLKILLPGTTASGLDYTSYAVWGRQNPYSLYITTFDGEALSFGVLTPLSGVPTTGSATYTGYMDGYFANGAYDVWSLTGNANLTVDFTNSQLSGSFNNISAGNIIGSGGGSAFADIVFDASISGGNFTGSASGSSGLDGLNETLSGSIQGSFFGPSAEEAGGVFQLSGSAGGEAIGAFAAQR